jgi:hypothetical protein
MSDQGGWDENRLRELDEALKFSARAHGWVFPDTTAEGILPEDPIPSLVSTLPADATEHQVFEAVEADFVLDELPPDLRFVVRAEREVGQDVVVVRADKIDLGSWSRSEYDEVLRRYVEAAG